MNYLGQENILNEINKYLLKSELDVSQELL